MAVADHLTEYSRSEVQRWIKQGFVLVDGVPAKAAYRLEGQEEVTVAIPARQEQKVLPEAIPLSVLYEDDDLIAIDKPAGMVVHPAISHESGTLVNAALHWLVAIVIIVVTGPKRLVRQSRSEEVFL